MRFELAAGWFFAALAGVATASAQALPPSEQARIAGIELERDAQNVRLLVFADRAVDFQLSEPDLATLVLHFPGTSLGPGAGRRIESPAGPVRLVTAFETAVDGPSEVQVVIQRETDVAPEVSRRGSVVAVRFPRPARRESAAEDRVALHFEDASLAEVVGALARASGERIAFDAEVPGRISVLGPEPVHPEDAREVLDAVLGLRGLAAVEAPGDVLKVVPMEGAPATGVDGTPVAIVLPLRHAASEDVLAVLDPLDGEEVVVLPRPHAPGLVLVGPEWLVRQRIALVGALDQPGLDALEVHRLRHHGAEDAAALLESAFAGRDVASRRFAVWADPRSNSLVLRSHPALRGEVLRFLEALDRPAESEGSLHVLTLRYADPEGLAETLRALALGERRAPWEHTAEPGDGDGDDAPESAGDLVGRDLRVAVHRPTRSLLVSSDAETARRVAAIVGELDRVPPSIEVEVAVAEIELSESLALGFDFVAPLTNADRPGDLVARVLSNPSGGGLRERAGGDRSGLARFTRRPLEIPLVGPDGEPFTVLVPRESFALTVNDGEVRGRVLMRPRLRMLSGREQLLFAGNNVPVPVASAQAAPLEVRQDVQRQDVGLRLRVRSSVATEGGVKVALDLEMSQVIPPGLVAVGSSGDSDPVFRQRRIESEVHLPDDAWALVALAFETRRVRSESGAPFLRSIPILGRAFRTTEERLVKNHLMVSARARVHRDDTSFARSVRLGLGRERLRSRLSGLSGEPGNGAYALRAGTLRLRSAAEALASQLDARGLRARIVEWTDEGAARFDVYLTGFASLASAVGEALRQPLSGRAPQIVAVPESLSGP